MDIVGAALGRQKTKPPKRADKLAEIVLADHDGADVRLGTLWEDRLAVLVWLRHYG